jgi:hypothetical protein
MTMPEDRHEGQEILTVGIHQAAEQHKLRIEEIAYEEDPHAAYTWIVITTPSQQKRWQIERSCLEHPQSMSKAYKCYRHQLPELFVLELKRLESITPSEGKE